MSTDADKLFFDDLTREDDLGLVVKAHLHIEHQLAEFIQLSMPNPEKCDWTRVGYAAKLEIAIGMGLPDQLRKPLEAVGKLRNSFAHNLNYSQSQIDAVALYNGLPARLHAGVKETYRRIRGEELKPSKLSNRDLLVIMLLNLRQAIQAEVQRARGAA
jgi:hypothetical protein